MTMNQGLFFPVAATEDNCTWYKLIERQQPLDSRHDEIRSEFGRDYTRILHSLAYRRLKHKTQVFFNTHNDHICTRMEHVSHVESVSFTIAKYLGLNTELTKAIAIGHDLGHAPFGHQGEEEIKKLAEHYLGGTFWHEKHSLHCVDNLELLENKNSEKYNLYLTYAVRDGIISHCGEVDENAIFPRNVAIDLEYFDCAGKYQPFSWEACVVKVSDKISYIGRDIEDAFRLKFLGWPELFKLKKTARKYGYDTLNTTLLIHEIIIDLCKNSSPESGLRLSPKYLDMMNEVKCLNYEFIYYNKKLDYYKKLVKLVLESLFDFLNSFYSGEETLIQLRQVKSQYPELIKYFEEWLTLYSDVELRTEKKQHRCIYGKLETLEIFQKAIFDFIAGMTDQFAIKVFNEITSF